MNKNLIKTIVDGVAQFAAYLMIAGIVAFAVCSVTGCDDSSMYHEYPSSATE